MMPILKTRLILWKKSLISLLFWLFLPTALTIAVIYMTNLVSEDIRIPIGIVVEDDSQLAAELVAELKDSPMLYVMETDEHHAKRMVESHDLDSAFIIREGYEENIQKGNRNRLIIGYESDLSFAYTVTRETILSLVQKHAGRYKTVHTVNHLLVQNDSNSVENEAVINKAIEIESNQDLLKSSFSFYGDSSYENGESGLSFSNPWALWLIFNFLSMLFIFDWVIKEKQSYALIRLTYSRFPTNLYFSLNLIIYFGLFFLADLIALIIFQSLYDFNIDGSALVQIICFRLTGIILSFALALFFRHLTIYYAICLIIILFITITSGVLIPIDGILNQFKWAGYLNPLLPFLSEGRFSLWTIPAMIFICLYFFKGEKRNA